MESENVYERYGLWNNPFQSQATNRLQEVSGCHVDLPLDDELASIKKTVFSKQKNAVVFLIGQKGMGKTERIMIARREAEMNDIFSVHLSFTNECTCALELLLESIAPKASALLSSEKWEREIAKLKGKVEKGYDPQHIAEILTSVFQLKTPVFLLLDDVHLIIRCSDQQLFFTMLASVVQRLPGGLFVLCTAETETGKQMVSRFPPLKQMMTRGLEIARLSDQAAEQIIENKMRHHRIVSHMTGLFPFSSDTISSLNKRSGGHPVRLLNAASVVLTAAAHQKAISISDQFQQDTFQQLEDQPWFSTRDMQIIPQALPALADQPSVKKKRKTLFSSKPKKGGKQKKKTGVLSKPFSKKSLASSSSGDNGSSLKKYKSLSAPSADWKKKGGLKQKPSKPLSANEGMVDHLGITPVSPDNKVQGPSTIAPNSSVHNNNKNSIQPVPIQRSSAKKKNNEKTLPKKEKIIAQSETKKKSKKKTVKTAAEEKKQPKTKTKKATPVEKNKTKPEKPVTKATKQAKSAEPSLVKHEKPVEKASRKAKPSVKAPSVNRSQQDNGQKEKVRVVKVRCPECSQIFQTQLDDKTKELHCPHCGFTGGY